MKNLYVVICLVIFANSCFISAKRHKESSKKNGNGTKPHIIVIMGDDIGWNDFSFHGSNQIPTPNIDALGYNGVFLNRFYTQQTCTPSRAAFLTGNYPIRSGLQGWPNRAGEDRAIPVNVPTMAERLKELGYKTHLVGKWHLGSAFRNQTPTGRGFDSHFGYWNGFVGYFNYICSQAVTFYNMSTWNGFDLKDRFQDKWEYQGKYITDVFTEKSLEIIDNHAKDSAKEPMFLYLSHLAGHTGWDGFELGVKNITEVNKKFGYIKDQTRRNYTETINQLDKSIGAVVKRLKAKNMLENSVILFFPDNGAQTAGMFPNAGSGYPFRGQKFTLYEGGVRGSAVLYSPLLKKKGYINNNLMHISDWLPTFYHLGGGNVLNLGNLDGINQWETISENKSTTRNEILLNIDEVNNLSGIITDGGRYKLINGTHNGSIYDTFVGETGRDKNIPKYDIQLVMESDVNEAIQSMKGSKQISKRKISHLRKKLDITECRSEPTTVNCTGFCLFDLKNDPCETKDVLKNNTKIVEKIMARLSHFWKEYRPQNMPHITDIASDPRKFNGTWCTWKEETLCPKSDFSHQLFL